MKIKIYAIGKIKEKYLKDGINEYLDQVQAALSDTSAVVRNNAAKSIHWFAELGEEYKYMAKKALSNSPVDVM